MRHGDESRICRLVEAIKEREGKKMQSAHHQTTANTVTVSLRGQEKKSAHPVCRECDSWACVQHKSQVRRQEIAGANIPHRKVAAKV